MTKSTKPKVAAETARGTKRVVAPKAAAETAPKAAAEKSSDAQLKSAPKVATETARGTQREVAPKAAAEKSSDAQRKSAPKAAAETARATQRVVDPKAAAEKSGEPHRKIATNAVAETTRGMQREVAAPFDGFRTTQVLTSTRVLAEKSVTHQVEESHAPQVPDSMRALAERSVAQTRELYERSTNAFKSILESWERSLDAAGRGTVALNRNIIDIAERNISTGFDLATSLAGAKNLAEAMEVQAAYWRKQLGDLSAQAEEVRALSTKVTADVAEPINAQVTRGMGAFHRAN